MTQDREPGVPLAHYVELHAGTGVRFTCLNCMAIHDVPMDRVIARLKAAGLGDEATGIKTLGHNATEPCARCGKVFWDTSPLGASSGSSRRAEASHERAVLRSRRFGCRLQHGPCPQLALDHTNEPQTLGLGE